MGKMNGEKILLLFLFCLLIFLISAHQATAACFEKEVQRQGWSAWRCGFACSWDRCDNDDADRCEEIASEGRGDAAAFRWESQTGQRAPRTLSRSQSRRCDGGDDDACYYRRMDQTFSEEECYTAADPENANHARRDNHVCRITAGDRNGECVPERETGNFCCVLDDRKVTITRDELEQADDTLKEACGLNREQQTNEKGPGILQADGSCVREEVIERVNLNVRLEPQDNVCPEGQVICGAKEKDDDAADKTGLDFIQCCTVNEPVRIIREGFEAQNVVFPEEGEQEDRIVQCENAKKPVVCGAVKNAENEFGQMQCCGIEGINIETRTPRVVIITDTEKQCDVNEFACGFVQAEALVGGGAFGGGRQEFINAPGGILCCKDRTAAERAEDVDDDKVLNQEDRCNDTPFNERAKVVTPAFAAQHPDVRDKIGCSPSQMDADENSFICEELAKGTWLTRKMENGQLGFADDGACCGGGFRLESFSKQGLGVTQACLWNEPLGSIARGGGDILRLRKPLGDHVPSVNSRADDSFESPSTNSQTGESSYRLENGVVVIPPGGSANLRPVKKPNGNTYTLAFDYLISKPGDLLDVQQKVVGNQLFRTSIEYVTPAFQRKKIVLAPHETIRISFVNLGEHPIRIQGEQIYAGKAQKVLHVNSDFFGCAMDENTRQSIKLTDPKTEERVSELILAGNIVQSSCAADQKKSGFYCSFENVWKKGTDRNEEKQIPSGDLLRSVEINPQTFPSFSPKDCCAASECWDGAACVASNFEARFRSGNGQKGLFCNNGKWEAGIMKTNQFNDDQVLCPEATCAYKIPQGHTCKEDGFYGPAVGGTSEDVFCDAGTWTSRPAKLAQILATRIGGVGTAYSLYCDTPEEVLVNKGYAPALPGEVSQFMQNGGATYACVLEFNTHAFRDAVFKGLLSAFPLRNQNVIVALALKENDSIITVADDRAVLPALDPEFGQQDRFDGREVKTYCYGAFKYQDDPSSVFVRKPDNFYGCTGIWEEPLMNYGGKMLPPSREASVWYSRRINTILYSPNQFRFLAER